VVSDTDLFRNLRINLFIYYFLTVATFLGVLHYFLAVVIIENTFLLAIVLLSLVALSGVFISKLSVDPLQEHVINLQNLSKETLHELNLPISTIMTNTHMLRKNMSSEKDLKRLFRIESACVMLQQRYNELDYMIKKQTLQEMKENFNLDELVTSRVEFLQSIYPHIKFNLELQNMQIFSDKIGLSKVIDNIIDNGIKYSFNSNIISIKLTDGILHIQDYGCGMDEVELLQIFDNYYQSNKNMQGFGIGLSMVKRFCDMQNIQLSFNSKPDNGTTVLLKFKEI
jgi:two-component system, OmpR family, sensor kinase